MMALIARCARRRRGKAIRSFMCQVAIMASGYLLILWIFERRP